MKKTVFIALTLINISILASSTLWNPWVTKQNPFVKKDETGKTIGAEKDNTTWDLWRNTADNIKKTYTDDAIENNILYHGTNARLYAEQNIKTPLNKSDKFDWDYNQIMYERFLKAANDRMNDREASEKERFEFAG